MSEIQWQEEEPTTEKVTGKLAEIAPERSVSEWTAKLRGPIHDWDEKDEHMAEVSRTWPEVLFTVQGGGEDQGDQWRSYHQNGKTYTITPETVWPEFDPALLEGQTGAEPGERTKTAPTARYYVDIPLRDIERVEQTLTGMGMGFCQFENMVHLPRANLLEGIFSGADGDHALEKINEHLRDSGKRPIPREFFEMTHRTRRDFLELATMHTEWKPEYAPELIYIEPGRLAKFMEEHFPEEDSPEE